jgi:hypothetical protein
MFRTAFECAVHAIDAEDESQFWRDMEATTRLSKPSRAKLIILDLIRVRAEEEAAARGDCSSPFALARIAARKKELLRAAAERGYPLVPLRHVRIFTRIDRGAFGRP